MITKILGVLIAIMALTIASMYGWFSYKLDSAENTKEELAICKNSIATQKDKNIALLTECLEKEVVDTKVVTIQREVEKEIPNENENATDFSITGAGSPAVCPVTWDGVNHAWVFK